jgi:hypothetical protein
VKFEGRLEEKDWRIPSKNLIGNPFTLQGGLAAVFILHT